MEIKLINKRNTTTVIREKPANILAKTVKGVHVETGHIVIAPSIADAARYLSYINKRKIEIARIKHALKSSTNYALGYKWKII